MKSFTTLVNLVQSLTNKVDTNGIFAQFINDGQRYLLSLSQNWGFLDASATTTTIKNQQFYPLPFDIDKLETVTIQSTTYLWRPTEVTSRQNWDLLNISTVPTADMVQYFYIYAGQIGFWPKPASTGLTITMNYKKAVKDLGAADYSTGTITLTNSSTAVVGSGTTFTQSMVGRWIQGTVDEYWYQIASVTNATNLVLAKPFQGVTGSALAYTIGEMPALPETYQVLPAYWACSQYWKSNGNPDRASQYDSLFQDGKQRLIADQGNKTSNVALDENIVRRNPNLYVTL